MVYESICTLCNPSSLDKGELKKQDGEGASLYVGESSRSIQERALEHWGAANKMDKKSHMTRHQALQHPGDPPEFIFKVVGQHRTALSRQIHEAVRIRRRGGEARILNSKGEWNRCHIPRLVMEEVDEDDRKELQRLEQERKDELLKSLEDDDQDWKRKKTRDLELLESKRRRTSEGGDEDVECEGGGRRRAKKLKYSMMKED